MERAHHNIIPFWFDGARFSEIADGMNVVAYEKKPLWVSDNDDEKS